MRESLEDPDEEKSEGKTERKAGVKVGVVSVTPIKENILNAGGCKREESGTVRSCALTGRSLFSLSSLRSFILLVFSRLSHFVPHAGKK